MRKEYHLYRLQPQYGEPLAREYIDEYYSLEDAEKALEDSPEEYANNLPSGRYVIETVYIKY